MNILVIDDDIILLKLLSKFCILNNINIIAFNNVYNAFEYLQKHTVNAILLDWNINNITSDKYLTKLHSISSAKIIIITGESELDIKEEILYKPFKLQKLKTILYN